MMGSKDQGSYRVDINFMNTKDIKYIDIHPYVDAAGCILLNPTHPEFVAIAIL